MENKKIFTVILIENNSKAETHRVIEKLKKGGKANEIFAIPLTEQSVELALFCHSRSLKFVIIAPRGTMKNWKDPIAIENGKKLGSKVNKKQVVQEDLLEYLATVQQEGHQIRILGDLPSWAEKKDQNLQFLLEAGIPYQNLQPQKEWIWKPQRWTTLPSLIKGWWEKQSDCVTAQGKVSDFILTESGYLRIDGEDVIANDCLSNKKQAKDENPDCDADILAWEQEREEMYSIWE